MLELAPDMPMGQLRADFYRAADNLLPRRQTLLLSYALALSVLVHVAGFVSWDDSDSHIDLQRPAPAERSISVHLTAPQPAETLPVEVMRAVPASLEPAPRRELIEPPRKPEPAPVLQHKPSQQKTAAPAVAAVAPEPVRAQKTAAASARSTPDAAAIAAQQHAQYLARLFAHIEQFKFYPSVARRQGLEAAVDVSFLLVAGGNVKDISINSGPKLLRHAAQQSLQRAAPLPAPPAGQSLPMRVEYRMVFALH